MEAGLFAILTEAIKRFFGGDEKDIFGLAKEADEVTDGIINLGWLEGMKAQLENKKVADPDGELGIFKPDQEKLLNQVDSLLAAYKYTEEETPKKKQKKTEPDTLKRTEEEWKKLTDSLLAE